MIIYSQNETLSSNESEWATTILNNRDESHEYTIEAKKQWSASQYHFHVDSKPGNVHPCRVLEVRAPDRRSDRRGLGTSVLFLNLSDGYSDMFLLWSSLTGTLTFCALFWIICSIPNISPFSPTLLPPWPEVKLVWESTDDPRVCVIGNWCHTN